MSLQSDTNILILILIRVLIFCVFIFGFFYSFVLLCKYLIILFKLKIDELLFHIIIECHYLVETWNLYGVYVHN